MDHVFRKSVSSVEDVADDNRKPYMIRSICNSSRQLTHSFVPEFIDKKGITSVSESIASSGNAPKIAIIQYVAPKRPHIKFAYFDIPERCKVSS